jgi:hypothetical protein
LLGQDQPIQALAVCFQLHREQRQKEIVAPYISAQVLLSMAGLARFMLPLVLAIQARVVK